jgi:hypothetical protein
MKSIEEIEHIFSVFKEGNKRMIDISQGENWKITVFRPFDRNGTRIYSFRLYGEISGSKFEDYNDKPQWCGGVDYLLNLETKELVRSDYEHKLNDIILKHVDVNNLLKKV